ncbi:hypothetical protein QV06_11345 [Gallibacterium genomosp. 3]|uniref:NlpC/P60 domain-containing protein n=1 Tax=Gallibacterium genomosp. 3 TaxID=505345 RepID=A0A1A7PI44_9PAST|nr:C40 family peptidase [Gallibacterium genomosp. 3]OBX01809.1 hypothetical protein QV06_11345 [Gallibacterium genomosp. 3]
MDKHIKAAIQHAKECYPHESCGFFIIKNGRKKYIACENLAKDGLDEFVIGVEDYEKAEKQGEIVTVVHSHPDSDCLPSVTDIDAHAVSGYEWLIIGVNQDEIELHTMPAVTNIKLLFGRKFIHGLTDCYAFIRDYYKQELEIDLPDFTRLDGWWNEGGNLYLENFAKAGFVEVEDLQENDVILMTISAPVPNHGAVYLGDGVIGQHLYGRLSSKDIYGQYYRNRTTHILRYIAQS